MRCDVHNDGVFMVFFDPHRDQVDDGRCRIGQHSTTMCYLNSPSCWSNTALCKEKKVRARHTRPETMQNIHKLQQTAAGKMTTPHRRKQPAIPLPLGQPSRLNRPRQSPTQRPPARGRISARTKEWPRSVSPPPSPQARGVGRDPAAAGAVIPVATHHSPRNHHSAGSARRAGRPRSAQPPPPPPLQAARATFTLPIGDGESR